MFFHPFVTRGGGLGEDITLFTTFSRKSLRIFVLAMLGATCHSRLDTFLVIPLRNYALSSGSKVNKPIQTICFMSSRVIVSLFTLLFSKLTFIPNINQELTLQGT